jgi:hypothetical protein
MWDGAADLGFAGWIRETVVERDHSLLVLVGLRKRRP